jgi:hypothetical protein
MALASSPAAVSSSTRHHTPRISVSSCFFCPPSGAPCPLRVATASTSSRSRGRGHLPPPAALPDPQAAAALLLAAAGTVGAASLLLRSSSSGAASQQQRRQEEREEQVEGEECPDCGGTGLCGRCKGEGFVFKQLSEETATRARKAAKNMATRYTSGYSLFDCLLSAPILAAYLSIYPSILTSHQSKNMTNCIASVVAGCPPSGPTATSALPPAPAQPAEAPAESSPHHLSPS